MNTKFSFPTLREPTTTRIVVVTIETQKKYNESAVSIAIPIARTDQHAILLGFYYIEREYSISAASIAIPIVRTDQLALQTSKAFLSCACSALRPHCIESIEHKVSVALFIAQNRLTCTAYYRHQRLCTLCYVSLCVSKQLRERTVKKNLEELSYI